MADNEITVPTYEKILKVLTKLATTYTNMASVFYDVFYNTEPKDVTFEMFNKEGELVEVTIPNRAKDLENLLSGEGSPEGSLEASVGVLYQDLLNGDLYIKETESGNEGWNQFTTKAFLESVFIQGNGTPEGVVSAPKGLLYIDINDASLYIHTEENGNTGWELISATSGSFADRNLDNLTDEGKAKIANPDLSNLTVLGETHFANPSLSNLSEAGRNLLNSKETIENKVTSITATSSNTQYPSAKAVYTFLASKQDKLVSGETIKTVEGQSLIGSGNVTILPSRSGNAGKFLHTDGSNMSWQAVSGIPTGCVLWYAGKTSTSPEIPQGFLVCNGASPSISSYYNLYVALGSGTIYGATSTTFKIPDISERFIEGGSNINVGTLIEAGIPNIKGNWPTIQGTPYNLNGFGAAVYVYKANGASSNMDNSVSGTAKENVAGINANRCSSVYKDNVTTVQPPAIVLIPIIKY